MDLHWLAILMAGEDVPGAARPGDTGPASATQDTEPPLQPGVNASPVSFHEINLGFSAASDNEGVVRRDLYRDGVLLQSLAATSLAYTDAQLEANTLYSYFLIDYDAAGNFATSVAASAVTYSDYRIDSGQTYNYTDQSGAVWYADTALSGATLQGQVTTNLISGTNDPVLYQSAAVERTSGQGFEYTFPIPNGEWRVELHWAEYDAVIEAGDRLMLVTIAGTQVETGLDVYAEAGLEAALVKSYSVSITDETLRIGVVGVAGLGFLSALAILPELDVPGSIASSNVTATSFDVSVPAVSDAVAYNWYLDAVYAGQSISPAFSFAGLLPSTAYDVTVSAVDVDGYETAQSAAIEVTTSAASAATPVQLDAVYDASTYFVVMPWGSSPEMAEEIRVRKFVSFRGVENVTRFAVAVLEEGEQADQLDVTTYPTWVVRLYTGAIDATPDYTLDSSANAEYFDLTDPSSVGVLFGAYSGGIPAAVYTGVLIAEEAGGDQYRVREEFLLDHRET